MQTSCPGCGTPVTFSTPGSYVAVCGACHTAVARADFANLGKVGDLAASESPLALGLAGTVGQDPFVLVGRAQRRNAAGGLWEEWYAHFPRSDRWGWLSEAQGQFHLLFEQTLAQPLPQAKLALGAEVTLEGHAFTVREVGAAQTVAAAGELPFTWRAGEPPERYADATGPLQAFVTLSPDSPELVYLGRTVTLSDLGLAAAAAAERPVAAVASRRLACPQCGGSLELFAPDRAERMGCPYCGALLDVRSEAASILQAAKKAPLSYDLALGSQGLFAGVRYRLLGVLRKATQSDGETYTWDEYLLYAPQVGYRWLVCAQGHWSLVEPVPGEVVTTPKTAVYEHETYKLFSSCTATVQSVLGEFYWQVKAGQQTDMEDYVAPPHMLSREEDGQEVTWSRGTYLPRKAVEKAFGKRLPDLAQGVGPHEPWPHRGVFKAALAFTVIAYMLKWTLSAALSQPVAYNAQVAVGAETQTTFGAPFRLESGHNVAVTAAAPGATGWVHVDGDLVEEASGTVLSWSVDLDEGDGDEPSALGDKTVWLSAPPDGSYTLRTEGVGSSALPVTITVQQGVPNSDTVLHFALFNWLVALIFLMMKVTFEGRRWQNSDAGVQP